jgi:hypothetical protein
MDQLEPDIILEVDAHDDIVLIIEEPEDIELETVIPITGTLYGVGSLYVAENSNTNPANILGFGTWQIRSRIHMTWDNAENMTWDEIEQYTWDEIGNMTLYVWKRIS